MYRASLFERSRACGFYGSQPWRTRVLNLYRWTIEERTREVVIKGRLPMHKKARTLPGLGGGTWESERGEKGGLWHDPLVGLKPGDGSGSRNSQMHLRIWVQNRHLPFRLPGNHGGDQLTEWFMPVNHKDRKHKVFLGCKQIPTSTWHVWSHMQTHCYAAWFVDKRKSAHINGKNYCYFFQTQ